MLGIIVASINHNITLDLKGRVHFLQREGRMNSKIYVNQVLKELGLPFYNRCRRKRQRPYDLDGRWGGLSYLENYS